jgi:hypothetical protein
MLLNFASMKESYSAAAGLITFSRAGSPVTRTLSVPGGCPGARVWFRGAWLLGCMERGGEEGEGEETRECFQVFLALFFVLDGDRHKLLL